MATQGAAAPAPKKQPPAAASRELALWPAGPALFGDDFRRMVEAFLGDPAARGLFEAPLALRGWPSLRHENAPVPAVDMEEKPDESVVRAEIPGLGREDLSVSLMIRRERRLGRLQLHRASAKSP